MALKCNTSFWLVLQLIIFCSCSSRPPRTYEVLELEGQADSYVAIGDRVRVQGRSEDALTNYYQALNIYSMKFSPQKYIIVALKSSMLLAMNGNTTEALNWLDRAKSMAREGKIDVAADMALTEAMLDFYSNRTNEGIKKLQDQLKLNELSFEKEAYMRFLLASKSKEGLNEMEAELSSNLERLLEMYKNGSLENVEVILYASTTLAEINYQLGHYQKMLRTLETAKFLHRATESVVSMGKVYKLYSDCYKALGNQESMVFYDGLYRQLISLTKKN